MGIIEKKFQLILHPTNVLTRRKNKHLELLRSAAKNVTNREGKHMSLVKFMVASGPTLPINCSILATVTVEGRAGSQGLGGLLLPLLTVWQSKASLSPLV